MIQIANSSVDSIRLHPSLCLGHLPTVSVVAPHQLRVNAVANTPVSDKDIRRARSDLEGPLSIAFSAPNFTSAQNESVLDLSPKYRPVFSLSMSELRRCTIAEATFPVPPGTRHVDRPPYRPNPRTSAVIAKCVSKMWEWGIIEQRSSSWRSPCTLVAKSNGSPRFCVDYRHIFRKCCPMPNLESCLDAVGKTLHISVTDILSAFWQLPMPEEHVDRTASIIPSGKYRFKRMTFEVSNALWLFQHVMSFALGHFGHDSDVLSYMYDLICINHTFDSHLVSLEKMHAALQAAGLTLKPSKI